MIRNNIFSQSKIFLVRDPVINVNEINKSKKLDIENNFNWLKNEKYIISIGRLTKQKNFQFLISEFSKISINFPDLNLIILELKIYYHHIALVFVLSGVNYFLKK